MENARGGAVKSSVGHDIPTIAVLGCGSVGGGVVDALEAMADEVALVAILVRDLAARADDVARPFTDSMDDVWGARPDILIELLGGADAPAEWMGDALSSGVHVVTANKAAVAKHYDDLHEAAARGGAHFAFSAAVGGGAPILEIMAEETAREVVAVEGVMNGTANFILDRLADGCAFDAAVRLAQDHGFAEADPSADVDGHDAADKLSILMRQAFDLARAPDAIAKTSLSAVSAADIRAARGRGAALKQVGRASRASDGSVAAAVVIEERPLTDPMARLRNEENLFRLTFADGAVRDVAGKGAGREPTAGSVMGDVRRILTALAGEAGLRAAS